MHPDTAHRVPDLPRRHRPVRMITPLRDDAAAGVFCRTTWPGASSTASRARPGPQPRPVRHKRTSCSLLCLPWTSSERSDQLGFSTFIFWLRSEDAFIRASLNVRISSSVTVSLILSDADTNMFRKPCKDAAAPNVSTIASAAFLNCKLPSFLKTPTVSNIACFACSVTFADRFMIFFASESRPMPIWHRRRIASALPRILFSKLQSSIAFSSEGVISSWTRSVLFSSATIPPTPEAQYEHVAHIA